MSLLGALLLALTTVGLGFFNDDYLQLLTLEGGDTPTSPLDLFHFASGDPEAMRPRLDRGDFPWWTLPELKIAFWRPLSSALLLLDHELFGRTAWAWHLHSVLWYLALVGAAGAVLRRAIPGAVGALALLLFALDGAHAFTVAWLSNRNALVALAPALMGLALHLRWRESRRPVHLALALTALGLGLSGGESALGAFAYLAAYELAGAPGRVSERLQALAPAGLLGLLYLGLYRAYDYGARGSGMYVDPMAEPGRFVRSALARMPTMAGGVVLETPIDLWFVNERAQPPLVLGGVLALAVLLGALRAAWPRLTPEEQRSMRWLGLGAGLSLLPVAAAVPSSRLLVAPGLGAMALVAAVLVGAGRARDAGRLPWGLGVGAGVLGLAHLALAPVLWPLFSLGVSEENARGEQALQQFTARLDLTRLPGQRLVVLPLPDPALSIYMPIMLAARGLPRPVAWWNLSLSPQPQVFTRTGPASFELTLTRGHFFTDAIESIFRDPRHALGPGAQVELAGMTARVVEADAEGPTRLGFRFDVPLTDGSLLLLSWHDGTLRPFTVPPEGEPVVLSRQ